MNMNIFLTLERNTVYILQLIYLLFFICQYVHGGKLVLLYTLCIGAYSAKDLGFPSMAYFESIIDITSRGVTGERCVGACH